MFWTKRVTKMLPGLNSVKSLFAIPIVDLTDSWPVDAVSWRMREFLKEQSVSWGWKRWVGIKNVWRGVSRELHELSVGRKIGYV